MHVIAPDAEAASVAPLTAALVDEVVIAARALAAGAPTGRLEPPLRCVLDELPTICPLPKVASYLADGGGRGIQILWYAQSRSQLTERFGRDNAATIMGATSVMLYGGGLNDPELLRDLSGMLGQLDIRHRTYSTDRYGAGASLSEQVREVAVIQAVDIYRLKAFHALMMSGGVGGAVVRVLPWWTRPDAKALRAAMAGAAIRASALRTEPQASN